MNWKALIFFVAVSSAAAASSPDELIQARRPGRMMTKENQVNFERPHTPAVPAQTNQAINFDEGLRTLALSRATVRLSDLSQLYLKDHSLLKIVRRRDQDEQPDLNLESGELYFTSRGPPADPVQIHTPQVRGRPRGTEFLVRVDSAVQRTDVMMFQGEVSLSDATTNVVVRSGEAATAIAGQGIVLHPVIESKNIVQWWIFYPAVVNLDDLAFTPQEKVGFASSFAFYRSGDLGAAMRNYPGYPAPRIPGSDSERAYLAALLVSVGMVEQAHTNLMEMSGGHPIRMALQTMIDAVAPGLTNTVWPARPLVLDSDFSSVHLANSYYYQARHDLAAALQAARKSVQLAPRFAFGWARVGELEFSHGNLREAEAAIDRSLVLGPKNAEAHSLRGFLLAARMRFGDAIKEFNEAIVLDPALGSAWLGRGLCQKRLAEINSQIHFSSKGSAATNWLSDLQTAAIVEPRHSLLRSYSGKAFAATGETGLALKELEYAKSLDAFDPTPWLYSAQIQKDRNRFNTAVDELDESIRLNNNRAVYRSGLLLDSDQAVRSASLAGIFRLADMSEAGMREAVRGIAFEYTNPSAHQFVAESLNSLRDPSRFNLRLETAWFNEYLLASLLSPSGAVPLSQNVSQQEYSRLFEADRFGASSSTEFRSNGQWWQQWNLFGREKDFDYSLDFDYYKRNNGFSRHDLDRFEWYSHIKYQLTPFDSLWVLTKIQDFASGDDRQLYDPAATRPDFLFREEQKPLLALGYHREWHPGSHSLFLAGRLESEAIFSDSNRPTQVFVTNSAAIVNSSRVTFSDFQLRQDLDVYFVEANQIVEREPFAFVFGGRAQSGRFRSSGFFTGRDADLIWKGFAENEYDQNVSSSFNRFSLYSYNTFRPIEQLSMTLGATAESAHYPLNFRAPPITAGEKNHETISPKLSAQWSPSPVITLRGMVAHALGGISFDESFRLEPAQLAGFSQAFRSVISEAEVGSVTFPEYRIGGIALDFKLPTRTFAGLTLQRIESRVAQEIGGFGFPNGLVNGAKLRPTAIQEQLDYLEDSARFSLNQLIGSDISIGAAFQVTRSTLDWCYPQVAEGSPAVDLNRRESALLQQLEFRILYQSATGFFGSVESLWFWQKNTGYGSARGNEAVDQLNMLMGYRFPRQRAELAVGILNLTDRDFRLNSLTPFHDLPRGRAMIARLKLRL